MSAVRTIVLREWERLRPHAGSLTRGVRIDDPRSRDTLDALARGNRMIVRELRDGLEIEARQWVGRVRLGDLEIAIVPKLAQGTLVALFRYAYGLEDLELFDRVHLGEGAFSMADLVVAELHAEASALLRRGLHRRYLRRTEVMASPRGRIAVGELARGPLLTAEIPCVHHPRDVQWRVNRIVRAGLAVASDVAQSPALRKRVSALEHEWASQVDAIPIDVRQVRRARTELDRLTERYAPALTVIEMLLESLELALDDDAEAEHLRVPGFLFDMNHFFEALVTRVLREHLPGATVRSQVKLDRLFESSDARRGTPVPRPDLEVRIGARTGIYLDAKYRDLWARSLPREMLYQLAVYAVASRDHAAAILYPTESETAKETRIEMTDATGHARTIALRPIVLKHLLAALQSPSPQPMRTLASALALGGASARG